MEQGCVSPGEVPQPCQHPWIPLCSSCARGRSPAESDGATHIFLLLRPGKSGLLQSFSSSAVMQDLSCSLAAVGSSSLSPRYSPTHIPRADLYRFLTSLLRGPWSGLAGTRHSHRSPRAALFPLSLHFQVQEFVLPRVCSAGTGEKKRKKCTVVVTKPLHSFQTTQKYTANCAQGCVNQGC